MKQAVFMLLLIFVNSNSCLAKERVGEAEYQITSVFIDSILRSEYVEKHGRLEHKLKLASYRISSKERSVSVFDRADQYAKFCENDETWICVESNLYQFAIPIGDFQDEWTRNGVTYNVLGETDLAVLGATTPVFVIVSKESIPDAEMVSRTLHYFSMDHGLLAFGQVDEDSGLVSLSYSTTKCGYGGDLSKCKGHGGVRSDAY